MTLETLQVVDHPRRRGRPPLHKEPCPSCDGIKTSVSQFCRNCRHSENGTTAKALIRLAATRPELNLTEAGNIVGVTRERVRQIANANNLPFYRGAHRKPRPVCWVCGEEVKGATFSPRTKSVQHQNGKCGWVTFICETCHKPKRMRRSQVTHRLKDPRYKTPYRRCSRYCPSVIREAPCVICGKIIKLTWGQSAAFTHGRTTRASCEACMPIWKTKLAAYARSRRKPEGVA